MKNWQTVLIKAETSILKTIEVIDHAGLNIAIVVDENQKLQGVVTDGDIRRGLLRGAVLTDPASKIMNKRPSTTTDKESREALVKRMKSTWHYRVPRVDSDNRVIGLEILEELLTQTTVKDNWVVLMAGGLGTRLKPLTDNVPKPLLHVGDKPLLETTLTNFIDQGFRRFYLSVNYKAEMIQEFFGDGSKWGAQIFYLHEKEQMGTAGALSLLPEPPSKPVVVMNGDLLTNINFNHLLDFHREHKALATMCIRGYDFQVPYGVVKVNSEAITAIDEKPLHKFFVNAGIYVLDPDAVRMIPKNQSTDMPKVFARLIEEKKKTTAFPIREYWLDIGQFDDFEKAKDEYPHLFPKEKKL